MVEVLKVLGIRFSEFNLLHSHLECRMVLNARSGHHGLDDLILLRQGHPVDHVVKIWADVGLDTFEHIIELTTRTNVHDPLGPDDNLEDDNPEGPQVPVFAPGRLRCILKLVEVRVWHSSEHGHQVLTFMLHELLDADENEFGEVLREKDVLGLDGVQGDADLLQLQVGLEKLEDDRPAIVGHQLSL